MNQLQLKSSHQASVQCGCVALYPSGKNRILQYIQYIVLLFPSEAPLQTPPFDMVHVLHVKIAAHSGVIVMLGQ